MDLGFAILQGVIAQCHCDILSRRPKIHYPQQTTGVFKMSLADNLAAAQAAVTAANATLASAQTAFDAAQPHLSVLAEIEAEAGKLEGEVQATLLGLVTKARELF